MGVSWPEGSSVRHIPSVGKLVVVNTSDSLRNIEEILIWANVVPFQIEVEVQFVEFELADIDAIAKQGRIATDKLNALRQKGKSRLLYAPRAVTQSGSEATVKGVREVIYPTTFLVWPGGTNTNDTVNGRHDGRGTLRAGSP